MDINFHGLRTSTSVDVKPAAEQSPGKALADINTHEAIERERKPTPVAQDLFGDANERRKELGQAVSYLREFAQSIQRDLTFSLDDDSGRVVIEVRDQASGDVIRQIPSEEALELMKHLEEARSLLFHEMV